MKPIILNTFIFLLISSTLFGQYQFTNYTTYNTGVNSPGSNTSTMIDENPVTNEIFIKYEGGVMRYDNTAFSGLEVPFWYDWFYDLEYAFDQAGNLWFGQNDSVYKYDWTNIYSYPIPTLSSNFNDILCDSQGNTWFARNNGIFKFDGTTMTEYSVSTGMLSDFISCIFEDSNGNIWVGCGMGLHKFDGVNWTIYNTASGFQWSSGYCSAQTIAEDHSGNIWIGSSEIGYFTNDVWTLLNPTILVFDSTQIMHSIHSITCDTSGVLWFGTNIDGIFSYDGVDWTSYMETDGLTHNRVNDVFADSQNRIWVTLETGGIDLFENNTWTNFNTSSGLAENKISDIFEDTTGAMWFCTEHGLSKLDTIWQSWFTDYLDGVKGGLNYDYNENLCLIRKNGQFIRRIDNDWEFLNISGSLSPDFISYVADEYWLLSSVGVTHIHIPYQVPSDLVIYNTNDGLPSNYCTCIERDLNDKTWVGTTDGIALYMWPGFQEIVPPSTDFSSRIHEIRYDWEDNIWFASQYGVAKFNGTTTWEFFFEADGLADNFVWDIEIGSDSTIWFATNNGISVLTDTGMFSITKADGLLSNFVYCLEEDHLGNMWAGTALGASKIHDATNSGTSSINNNSISDINIYPNPAQNTISISSNSTIKNIEIYNSMGQFIKNININTKNISIDISYLENGNYFLRSNRKNETNVSKFIIIK